MKLSYKPFLKFGLSIGEDFEIEYRTPESTTRRVRLDIEIQTQIPSFKKSKRGRPMGIPKRYAECLTCLDGSESSKKNVQSQAGHQVFSRVCVVVICS